MTSTCSTRDYRRSLDYLRLIFAHATRRVADVLKEKEGHYCKVRYTADDSEAREGAYRGAVEGVSRRLPIT